MTALTEGRAGLLRRLVDAGDAGIAPEEVDLVDGAWLCTHGCARWLLSEAPRLLVTILGRAALRNHDGQAGQRDGIG